VENSDIFRGNILKIYTRLFSNVFFRLPYFKIFENLFLANFLRVENEKGWFFSAFFTKKSYSLLENTFGMVWKYKISGSKYPINKAYQIAQMIFTPLWLYNHPQNHP
jgi:hypothetical protein